MFLKLCRFLFHLETFKRIYDAFTIRLAFSDYREMQPLYAINLSFFLIKLISRMLIRNFVQMLSIFIARCTIHS